MKKFITFIATALLWAAPLCPAADKVPALINYQGKLLDNSGGIVPNGNYQLEFRVWSAATGGSLIWGRTYPVNVSEGLFNVVLGDGGGALSGAQVTNLLAAFDGSDRFLGLTITKDQTGATISNPQEIQPRQQLLSTPYALQANNAAQLGGTVATNYLKNGDVVVTGSVRSPTLLVDDGAYFTVKNLSGGMNPAINFDGSDWLMYQRNENQFSFRIASAEKLRISSSNVVVPSGVVLSAQGGIEGPGTVPLGTIVMWSGSNVPSGWALCNGTTNNSIVTPDLRGRFVLASGSGSGLTARTIKQTGGEETHTLTVPEMPSHTHTTTFSHNGYPDGSGDRSDWYYIMNSGRGNDNAYGTSATGSGTAHNTMPPYYVLAFIMRVQ